MDNVPQVEPNIHSETPHISPWFIMNASYALVQPNEKSSFKVSISKENERNEAKIKYEVQHVKVTYI